MKFSSRLLLVSALAGFVCGSALWTAHAAEPVLTLADATKKETLHMEVTGNGRDRLKLVITNRTAAPHDVSLPAGLICTGQNGDRVITLRASVLSLAPTSTAEAEIPVAALSLKNTLTTQGFTVSDAEEPRLSAVLKLLALRNEVPRATSQLVVLALLENPTFALWQHFSAAQRSSQSSQSTDLIEAIDALGLLKEIAPDGDFALDKDNELKLRALRNPVCRAKAVQLFGLAMPENPGVVSQDAPDLKQLLHMQPGDNCPICKMRQRAERGAGDF